jgi:hypothetical protein
LLEQNFSRVMTTAGYYAGRAEPGRTRLSTTERDCCETWGITPGAAAGKGIPESEAIQSRFSKAGRNINYDLIVQVAERLPEQALQEDPQLKLYYDNALNRARNQPEQRRLL